MDIDQLLTQAVANRASDLHISAGLEPMVRVDGDLARVDHPPVDNDEVLEVLRYTMNEAQHKDFETRGETDYSYALPEVSRFRVNAFTHNRGVGAAFRMIPDKIVTLDELGAPALFGDLARLPRGIVLVTGPTGSGKSTTLAAMVDEKNRSEAGHILTIEDPIEFLHESKSCLVNQREVFRDTNSFADALRSALREDPDTILVGELRDLETIRLALTAAETGHLVLATVHTSSAPKTIDRVIDVFPGTEQAMVRGMLSESLRAVITQTLLKKNGGGRIAAHEIMVGTPAIRNLIREGKVAQMYSAIQTGQATGMQTLEQNLQALTRQGIISTEEARRSSNDPGRT